YRTAAEGAFAYERRLYDEGARNWPDLRERSQGTEGAATFGAFWCHGAPGIALSRIRALELDFDDGPVREEAVTALETTSAWVGAALTAGTSYSLCHGLAGNAEILSEGASLVGEDSAKLVTRDATDRIEAS